MSSLKHNVTLFLLLFFAISLFLSLAFFDLYKPTQTQKVHTPAEISIKWLFKPDLEQELTEFTVTNENGSFHLKRLNEEWMLINPLQKNISKDLIQDFFKGLRDIVIKDSFVWSIEQLESYHLSKPLVRLTFNFKSSAPKNIIFGMINTLDNSTTIMLEGGLDIYQIEIPAIAFDKIAVHDFIEPSEK
ncbi:MAG: hypothetical protein KBD63_06875 [Bacteriovoracaceae bacterium]|nr:hypothetical protein [Bacteriovoracaceae bacterium]